MSPSLVFLVSFYHRPLFSTHYNLPVFPHHALMQDELLPAQNIPTNICVHVHTHSPVQTYMVMICFPKLSTRPRKFSLVQNNIKKPGGQVSSYSFLLIHSRHMFCVIQSASTYIQGQVILLHYSCQHPCSIPHLSKP